MKKIFLLAGLFLATIGANAQNTVTEDEGVVINGVKWASRNVDNPGTFAATPEAFGKFYQWNRKIAWTATDPMVNNNGGTTWDSSKPGGSAWTKANDPSPTGWRVPTIEEIETLLDDTKVDKVWTSQNSITGMKFTDKISGKSIFLPAVGNRNSNGRNHMTAGPSGWYWCSTHYDSNNAQFLYFTNDSFGGFAEGDSDGRERGFSLRSIADDSNTAIGDIMADGRTITGYYSILGQPLADEPASGLFIVTYDNGKAEKRMK